jgi:hypothetical protein
LFAAVPSIVGRDVATRRTGPIAESSALAAGESVNNVYWLSMSI